MKKDNLFTEKFLEELEKRRGVVGDIFIRKGIGTLGTGSWRKNF